MSVGSIRSRRLTGTGRKPRSLLRLPRPRSGHRGARSALIMSVAFVTCLPAVVDAAPGETLGGGSDIRGGSVVELTGGATVGPIHHVFADNPGTESIDVQFRADAPPGIEIIPELDHFTIQPGASTKDFFSIALDPAMPPGDHTVTVQLVRSDIVAQPGEVTNVPAVGTSFTIRVTGAERDRHRRSHDHRIGSSRRRNPRVGRPHRRRHSVRDRSQRRIHTHTYSRPRPVSRQLHTRRPRARLPGSRRRRRRERHHPPRRQHRLVRSGRRQTRRPNGQVGHAVVANLTASVDNHLGPIAGDVTIHTLVFRAGKQIDTATLQQTDQLAMGVTEATLVYRPQAGFEPGRLPIRVRTGHRGIHPPVPHPTNLHRRRAGLHQRPRSTSPWRPEQRSSARSPRSRCSSDGPAPAGDTPAAGGRRMTDTTPAPAPVRPAATLRPVRTAPTAADEADAAEDMARAARGARPTGSGRLVDRRQAPQRDAVTRLPTT